MQKRYQVTLTGQSPLLMHRDNILFNERLAGWRKAPENKAHSNKGDDRSPAWTWIGGLYHDTHVVGIASDNLMTMLREGGAKISFKGKETYKKQTQSGILIDSQQWVLTINGNETPYQAIKPLIGELDFQKHVDTVEALGFELLVKRAKIGQAKHVRVRPMFRDWVLTGTLTVLDEELSGLTQGVLTQILRTSGSLCGLGDWRPSSGSSGTFGRFDAVVEDLK